MNDAASLIRASLRDSQNAIFKRDEQTRRAPERRAAGRYTLDEAAQEIQTDAGEAAARGIALVLTRAVKDGGLIAYRPGETVPCQPGAHATWLECYGEDLNAWLDIAAPRLAFRFTAPSTQRCESIKVTTNDRSDLMAPLVRDALAEVGEKAKTAEIFNKLAAWAKESPPRQPLRGIDDNGSLKWERSDGELDFMTPKKLSGRLYRLRKKQAEEAIAHDNAR